MVYLEMRDACGPWVSISSLCWVAIAIAAWTNCNGRGDERMYSDEAMIR